MSAQEEDAKKESLTNSFSEMLESGKEIEGLIIKKKDMSSASGKKPARRGRSSTYKEPLVLLKENVAIYNKKHDSEFHLQITEQDLSYSGIVIFQHHNGIQLHQQVLEVRSTDSTADLLPILVKRFLPPEFVSQSTASNTYIALLQGGSERELEQGEKPLEIALDYSTKGLSSPSFMLKTSSSFIVQTVSTPKHASNKISSSSLAASSYSSLGHTSSDGSDSPQVLDQDSMYSFSGSTVTTSPYNSFTHPPRTHRPIIKTQSHSTTPTHTTKPSYKLLHPYHISDPSLRVPDSPSSMSGTSPNHTPEMARKGVKKSRVSNLMDNIARSLKSKSKNRPTTIFPEEIKQKLSDSEKSPSLESPISDRRFSMPTVFHVYYSNAKNAQLYKSILISEHSTTLEVIKLALERYGMKFVDPQEYSLYEVVGKWEAMLDDSQALSPQDDMESSLGSKQKSPPVMEEFVTHYTREISSKEKPHAVQTYSTVPSGYKRRFELRAKEDDRDKPCVPSTPLFGSTMQRGRSHTSTEGFTFQSTLEENSETDHSVVRYRHSLPDVLDCSSPDSGLETKSSFTSDQSDTQSWSLYPVLSSGPFLLNLQLSVVEGEFLVYRVLGDSLSLVAGSSPAKNDSSSGASQHEVELNVPNGDGSTVCVISKEEESCYTLKSQSKTIKVYVNAVLVSTSVELEHGDLLKIGDAHLFMFQLPCGGASASLWPYRWSPVKTVGHPTSSSVATSPLEKVTVQATALPTPSLTVDSVMLEDVRKPTKVVYLPHSEPATPMDISTKLPTVQEVEGTNNEDESQFRARSLSESQKNVPQIPSPTKKRRAAALAAAARHRADDKKLMFSHDISEENVILELLITKLDPLQTVFKLAPAYIIAMCLEYSIKCNGTVAASRFACKAVECIQQTSWKFTRLTDEWSPQTFDSSQGFLDELSPILHHILFWLANSLELYNYLLSVESLNLTVSVQDSRDYKREDNAMTLLENLVHHLFQQVFYPISKALYLVLPAIFVAENEESCTACVKVAIDILKGVLDLMLELCIHTEMVAQLFTNTFFFLNGALFNTLIDQGVELDLFQNSVGIMVRNSLDMLEKWAGREGFKDVMSQFFASFSAVVDLLATPPHELIQLSWHDLKEMYPSLYPAQLHFILTNYQLPQDMKQPQFWTPPSEDAHILNGENGQVHESFESHPAFHLPIGGYMLDLAINQHDDDDLLQEFVEALQKQLKKYKRRSDSGKVKRESMVATIIHKIEHPNSPTSPHRRPILDVTDIVKKSPVLSRVSYDKPKQSARLNRTRSKEDGSQRDRVKSLVEPKLLGAPETVLVVMGNRETEERKEPPSDEPDSGDPTSQVPSRAVSLQRGNSGFGFSIKEDFSSGSSRLYIDSVTPEGPCSEVLSSGDHILAIDDFCVTGEDHQKALKYIKDAEEEITLMIAGK